MSCCICDKAGHDEEIHGEEGEEILALREQVAELRVRLEEARPLVVYTGTQAGPHLAAKARAWLSESKAQT